MLGHNSFDPGPVSEFSGFVPDRAHNEKITARKTGLETNLSAR